MAARTDRNTLPERENEDARDYGRSSMQHQEHQASTYSVSSYGSTEAPEGHWIGACAMAAERDVGGGDGSITGRAEPSCSWIFVCDTLDAYLQSTKREFIGLVLGQTGWTA